MTCPSQIPPPLPPPLPSHPRFLFPDPSGAPPPPPPPGTLGMEPGGGVGPGPNPPINLSTLEPNQPPLDSQGPPLHHDRDGHNDSEGIDDKTELHIFSIRIFCCHFKYYLYKLIFFFDKKFATPILALNQRNLAENKLVSF